MALTQSAEYGTTLGLHEESWNTLSSSEACSLLRTLGLGATDDRIYSSVALHPMADGSTLYVRPR